jgi:iron complex outermembrane receptor protein
MSIKLRHEWRLPALLLPALALTAPSMLLPVSGIAAPAEEVIVTTRRRAENAQDVPVAVAAFQSDFIEKQGVVSTADIVKLVPGVQFDQGFSAADTRISIRGINNSRGRASVAMLVDGVDVSGENVTAGGGSSLLNTRLFELERIEIVKGPQSALYGRNAFAGAINYVTKGPNRESYEFKVDGDVAEYDTYNIRGAVSGPIGDHFAWRLNVASYTTDGYWNNNSTGQPVNNFGQPIDEGNTQKLNGATSNGARLALLWAPIDTLDIRADIVYGKDESDPRGVVKVGNANTFYDVDGNVLPGVTTPEFSAFSNQAYGQWLGTVKSVNESDILLSSTGTGGEFAGSEDERWFGTLKVDWDFAGMTFKSLTSYLDNDASLQEDVDFQNGLGTVFMGVGLSVANDYQDTTTTKQFTQDFILQSSEWDRGIWLVGAQFFTEEVRNKDFSLGWYNDPATAFIPQFCTTSMPAGTISCSYAESLAAGVPAKEIDRDTDSVSIYGMFGYDITEKFSATLELRYVRDEIEVTTNTLIDRVGQYLIGLPIDLDFGGGPLAPLPTSDKQTTNEVNGRLALDYKFTDAVMLYGSVAKGTKPGGFGTSQMGIPQAARMDPETLWAYELGLKTQWFDQTLTANGAIFFNDYQDRQVGVTVTDPISGFPAAGIVNAGAAETMGLELELMWSATDNLTLGLGYAYTDAEWTDFNYSTIRANSPTPGPTAKDKAICGNVQGDCSGAPIAGIPENALTLIGNFTAPIGGSGLEWFINGNAQFEDERAVSDQINTAYIDSRWRADAQLGLQTEAWSVMVFATNLFDDDTVIWGQHYNDFRDGMYAGANGGEPRDETVMAFLPDPRIVGVRASYRFGGQ